MLNDLQANERKRIQIRIVCVCVCIFTAFRMPFARCLTNYIYILRCTLTRKIASHARSIAALHSRVLISLGGFSNEIRTKRNDSLSRRTNIERVIYLYFNYFCHNINAPKALQMYF